MKFIKFTLCLFKVQAAIALTAAVMASGMSSAQAQIVFYDGLTFPETK